MFPFLDCISIPGFKDNACANCVWSAHGATCEWAAFPGYQLKRTDKGSIDHPFMGCLSDSTEVIAGPCLAPTLDGSNAPRLTHYWPPQSNRDIGRLRSAYEEHCVQKEEDEFEKWAGET